MIILSGFALDNIVHCSIAVTEFIDAELCIDCVYACSLAMTVLMYAIVPPVSMVLLPALSCQCSTVVRKYFMESSRNSL